LGSDSEHGDQFHERAKRYSTPTSDIIKPVFVTEILEKYCRCLLKVGEMETIPKGLIRNYSERKCNTSLSASVIPLAFTQT